MPFTITEVKDHLSPMLHGGSLNRVRNVYQALERAQNTILLKCQPLETIRTAGLSQTVHDALYNYTLPSDFNQIIALYPQANRTSHDQARRVLAEAFDLRKALANRMVSIEANEGAKLIRIAWNVDRSPKTLHNMDSFNGNGTWSAVGSATGIVTDTIYKYAGGGSVRFDLVATGDGIQNTGMSAVDLTDEDELADVIVPVYLPSVTGLTSVTAIWGNNLTTKFWTSVAQTAQADGTAFRAGWNILKFPWSTATETGTVAPATINSFQLTVAATSAINDIRVDNIQFSIGYPFDLKYYSKYLFKNSAGTWLSRPTSDDDTIVLDNDSFQVFLWEAVIAIAHQLEGTDSAFDITFAREELLTLYQAYKGEHPSQSKKATASYGGSPRFRR